jgi:hypothetical protein
MSDGCFPSIDSLSQKNKDHIYEWKYDDYKYFEQRNTSYLDQLEDRLYSNLVNERASDDSLPPREEDTAPLSPLALRSSVARSWESSNHTVASQVQGDIKDSENTAMCSDSGLS